MCSEVVSVPSSDATRVTNRDFATAVATPIFAEPRTAVLAASDVSMLIQAGRRSAGRAESKWIEEAHPRLAGRRSVDPVGRPALAEWPAIGGIRALTAALPGDLSQRNLILSQ